MKPYKHSGCAAYKVTLSDFTPQSLTNGQAPWGATGRNATKCDRSAYHAAFARACRPLDGPAELAREMR